MSATTPSVDQINFLSSLASRSKQHRIDNPQPDWVVRRDTFMVLAGLNPRKQSDIDLLNAPAVGVEPTIIRLAYEQYRRDNPVSSDKTRKSASPAYAQAVQDAIEASFAD